MSFARCYISGIEDERVMLVRMKCVGEDDRVMLVRMKCDVGEDDRVMLVRMIR